MTATATVIHRRLTDVVGADLESLIPAHDETDLAGVLGGEETNVTGTTLLPLGVLLVETEELGAPVMSARKREMGGKGRNLPIASISISNLHLEEDVLVLLVGRSGDGLGEADHGLELGVVRLLGGLLHKLVSVCSLPCAVCAPPTTGLGSVSAMVVICAGSARRFRLGHSRRHAQSWSLWKEAHRRHMIDTY